MYASFQFYLCMMLLWLHVIVRYIMKVQIIQSLCSFIFLITIFTYSLCYSNIIGDPQNPCRSRCLQNLPPILGGVPSLTNSPTQASHTPVNATILGSNFLCSNLLGSNSQGQPSTSSPLQGSGGKHLLKGKYKPTQPLSRVRYTTYSYHGWN